MQQLVQLQRVQPLFRSLGIRSYAISGSSLQNSKLIAKQLGVTIPMIHDTGFRLGKMFGVYGGSTMPMDTHSIFVINRQGQAVLAVQSPRTMHVSMSRVLKAARKAVSTGK